MTQYLTLELLLQVAERACGTPVQVHDHGLLSSALARPAATVFHADAYPTMHDKAAALLHSLSSNHALVDGNKRLAWAAAAVFLWINGHDLDAPEDGAFDLVIAVADGSLTDVEKIAERLGGWSRPR
ncbi:MAG TPA: type II toxin-antitoxin system death-on-curing family toxin [Pseudonocardiaceae bacterium]|nr:type II toxin-antitoxin system death-on-curing family toxin [Pseudonocardiaceae bacterium]